jgi:glycosyltransferase involved in cell wall biosynthesis
LRILQASHYAFPHAGGIETMAGLLAAGLSRKGHSVEWFFARTHADQGSATEWKDHPLRAFNGLEKFNVPVPLVEPAGTAAALLPRLKAADVLLLHDCLSPPSQWASVLNRFFSRKPCLLVQHVGLIPYRSALLRGLQRAALAVVGKLCLAGADSAVIVAGHVEEFLRRDMRYRRPILHIPNGVPESTRRPNARESGGPFRLALVGRLTEKKNVPLALHLIEELNRRHPAVLVAVGDGPERPRVEAFGRRFPDALEFHGQLSLERAREIYAGCDAVLGLGVGEGFPLSLQEGMMAGLPAVAPAEPPYTDVLTDGAVLISREPKKAARAVETALVLDPARRRELSAAARRFAQENWGLARMVDRYESALLNLMDGRNRHAA